MISFRTACLGLSIAASAFGCNHSSTPDAAVDSGADTSSDHVDATTLDAPGDVNALDSSDAPTASDAVESGADAGSPDAADVVMNDAGPGWECLGMIDPDPSTGTTVTISFVVTDFLPPGAPIADLTVKACLRSDTTCAAAHPSGTTDATGTVSLTLPLTPTGWDGYFEVTGGDVFPTRYFTVVPITSSSDHASTAVLTNAEVAAFTGAAGVTVDPTQGQIVGNVFDCAGASPAGVVFDFAPTPSGAQQFYLAGGVPSTAAVATDSDGVGGLLNVPPGDVTMTATIVGDWIGATTLSSRAGYMSTFGMRPMPR